MANLKIRVYFYIFHITELDCLDFSETAFFFILKTLFCNSQTLSLGAYKMKLVMWLQNETFSVQWKNIIEIFNIWNYFEKSKFVLISTY